MKILQIISGMHVNGALMHCLLLSRQLAERGHEVTVMCRRQSWIWNRLEREPVKRIACDLKRRYRDLRFAHSFIRENGIEVCHTHMSRAHFFGVLLRSLANIPCVATAHACHLQLHWPFNDFVIANSQDTHDYQRRVNRVRPERLKTVYCFTDLEKFLRTETADRKAIRNQMRVSDDEFLIGIVGDVIARKGHQRLFQQLPELFEKHPQMKLAVIGRFQRKRPYVRKLRRFIVNNRLASRVVWTGRSDRVQDHMAALDLCVVPSVAEPLGLVAMEAMAARTPVVASRVGGLPEIIEDRVNGLLFRPDDGKALGLAIDQLVQNPEMRDRFVRNGLDCVRQKFSPDVLTAEVEQVLFDVVHSGLRKATAQAA